MQAALVASTKPLAVFDAGRVYRYSLYREWGDASRTVAFIMLNPSTADEVALDPTVLRCMRAAKRWGYGAGEVVNLFAYRSTDPRGLLAVDDPVGPENDRYIMAAAEDAVLVVAAWGVHGTLQGRAAAVVRLLEGVCELTCLGTTRAGHPRHPLYLRRDVQPVAWPPG